MPRRRTHPTIRLPITVRQAQRLVDKGGYYLGSLAELLGIDQSWYWSDQDVRSALARLAAKEGPDFVLGKERPLGEFRPKGTDEVRPQGESPSEDSPFHGGDGNSGECDHPAATVSPETGQAAAVGEQGSPGGGSHVQASPRPETDAVTSGVDACDGSSQSPAHGVADPSSTALGGEGVPDGNAGSDGADPLRDADGAESQAPLAGQDGEAAESANPNNLGEDGPNLRKKWGKLKAASRNPAGRDQHGGIYADLAKVGVDPVLLKLARKRLADLVGDTAQDVGPRYDWPEFCVRLKTYRDPRRARREEVGRPILWVLADVSGSCSSFAWPALQVAKACGALGVPGADVVVISHSNGYPANWECNGKPITAPLPEVRQQEDIIVWFWALARRYPPQVVVALGDWDAAQVYGDLAQLPEVERLLWLDNYGCSRGPRDQTAWARERLRERGVPHAALHKIRYVDGCRGAVEFVEQIRPH